MSVATEGVAEAEYRSSPTGFHWLFVDDTGVRHAQLPSPERFLIVVSAPGMERTTRLVGPSGGTVLKRCVDLLFAATLLIFALPVLLMAAIAIRLDSAGPVLYWQMRMGRGFRPFRICKLRTMRPATHGSLITLGDDARITRIGRWLRRSKLDEVPQLWNVLRGEMSLVGPRPVIPSLTEEFRSEYMMLLTVRPGLTDPATLKYVREAEMLAQSSNPLWLFKSVVTPDKLRLSAEYLSRASLRGDLGLLCATVGTVIPSLFFYQRKTDYSLPGRVAKLSPHAELRVPQLLQFPSGLQSAAMEPVAQREYLSVGKLPPARQQLYREYVGESCAS